MAYLSPEIAYATRQIYKGMLVSPYVSIFPYRYYFSFSATSVLILSYIYVDPTLIFLFVPLPCIPAIPSRYSLTP